MILFNKPCLVGREIEYIGEAVRGSYLSGNGPFTKRCEAMLEKRLPVKKALLTHSCTAALEIAAHLADLKPGDEVILPSFTFVSTANAFASRDARLVFVDIRPDTMNLDERLIEAALTKKTRVIVPVHYGGVACEMDSILAIAKRAKALVVEDAAQGLFCGYKGRPLGSIGDIGCFSFHETKNLTCGEGGAMTLKGPRFVDRAEVLREKGTNRSKFFRGEVDKYTWIDLGSNFLMSELNAAFLAAQLEAAERVSAARLKIWNAYYRALEPLAKQGRIELARVPAECRPNGHLFYLKTRDTFERARLIRFLKEKGIFSVFHYVPLHRSKAGRKYGRFSGRDRWTTRESERLLRLPLWYGMDPVEDVGTVVRNIFAFYAGEKRLARAEALKALS